jgi:tetratricopeptide (TPR) repeat protein
MTLRVAMGEQMSEPVRRAMLTRLGELDRRTGPMGDRARAGSLSIPYLGFLSSRDTAFRVILSKWSRAPYTELDALSALDRGDTATARTIAATFPSPDSLSRSRLGVSGLRSVARAEVLASLGMTRQAAETYEATKLEHVNRTGLAEPGYAVWARTWLARARLWGKLGEREKAIAAYEEFIRRWGNADSFAVKELTAAKQELAALRDAPRTQKAR